MWMPVVVIPWGIAWGDFYFPMRTLVDDCYFGVFFLVTGINGGGRSILAVFDGG